MKIFQYYTLVIEKRATCIYLHINKAVCGKVITILSNLFLKNNDLKITILLGKPILFSLIQKFIILQ